MAGLYRRLGLPAARVKGLGRFTRSVRTCWWLVLMSGLAVAAARCEQAGWRRRRTAELDGDGVLVEDRRREEASELREARAVLMAGSARAE